LYFEIVFPVAPCCCYNIVCVTILELNRQSQELEFNLLTEKSTSQIEDQLKTHEQVLIGFWGFFSIL
jgi:hypothetical protein